MTALFESLPLVPGDLRAIADVTSLNLATQPNDGAMTQHQRDRSGGTHRTGRREAAGPYPIGLVLLAAVGGGR